MSKHIINVSPIRISIWAVMSLCLSACTMQPDKPHREIAKTVPADSPSKEDAANLAEHHEVPKVVVAVLQMKTVVIFGQYDCPINSQKNLRVRAVVKGPPQGIDWYITEDQLSSEAAVRERWIGDEQEPKLVTVEQFWLPGEKSLAEGQGVKPADLMLKSEPSFRGMKPEFEAAVATLAQLESRKLPEDKVNNQNETLLEAKRVLAKTIAELDAIAELTASAEHAASTKQDIAEPNAEHVKKMDELGFSTEKAAFDGIAFLVRDSRGRLVEEDMITIYLLPADAIKIDQTGKIGAIDADFNKETGNTPVRGGFPNRDRLPRHGQAGILLIRREQHDALVIPQAATYKILEKHYIYIVDKEDVAHQREIVIQDELEQAVVIKSGVNAGERIVLKGIAQVRNGEKVAYQDAIQNKH